MDLKNQRGERMLKKYGHFGQRKFKGSWGRKGQNQMDDGKVYIEFSKDIYVPEGTCIKRVDIIRKQK
jgi:hypothetical protein